MFAIRREGGHESPLDTPTFLFDSPNEILRDPLLAKNHPSRFEDAPFGVVDNLGIYEQYSESGPSSVHFGGLDGTSDFEEVALKSQDGRQLPDVGTSEQTSMEAGIDGPSQLPTPARDSDIHSQKSSANSQMNLTSSYDQEQLLQDSSSQAAKPLHLSRGPTSPEQRGQKMGGRSSSFLSETQLLDTPSSKTRESGDSSIHAPSSAKKDVEMRPRASIPASLSPWEFSRQCLLAAYSSRLSPFSLHPGEYSLLKDHITLPQVSIYLNIRNAILRIWTRSPLVPVRKDEAAGCARDSRYFALADVAYNWLIRQGYINFGCLDLPTTAGPISRTKAKSGKRSTIVVIGAGMSGLGCARQLEGLIAQFGQHWTDRGERPPKVIVLEGRNRIGGRVYSHMLRDQGTNLPAGLRSTAEMGAQIVTGFEHGNPMNVIIRGQLALHTYALKDTSILYDYDGKVVEKERDELVEKLYNDVLERASVFRNMFQPPRTVEADRTMMQQGKEPSDDSGKTIAELENEGLLNTEADALDPTKSQQPKQAAISTEKLTGRAYQIAGLGSRAPAAEAARAMGWTLVDGTSSSATINLQPPTDSNNPGTLGDTMDDALMQYQRLIQLTPQDLRLFNWHNANLEYANAAKVSQLSLTGWDQDLGNEFEGEHSEVVGGYSQVPLGLWQSPYPLDVRFGKNVKAVKTASPDAQTVIECEDGEVFSADQVVVSVPLGVLKTSSINFSPSLPPAKAGAIERLGFGLLNKVIMVYDEAFWEEDRDMFGLLNQAELQESIEQKDYVNTRGRFFLFWNCIKTSGRPMLVALMAGDSAHQAEAESNGSLIRDLTARLRSMFGADNVPMPSESLITRWKRDPFACGSYSYVGPATRSDDYESMATPCGNIHFAGEATCGTHPATVHGAYLSGLRAAAEIIGDLLGPIDIPSPLVAPKSKADVTPSTRGTKRSFYETVAVPLQPPAPAPSKAEEYEASIIGAILAEIGERPLKPVKQGINPFLLYQKDHWYSCKASCDADAQRKANSPAAKASKNDIRLTLGHQWRTAPEEVRRPYLDRAQASRDGVAADVKAYEARARQWDREASRIREAYMAKNPPPGGLERQFAGRTAIEMGRAKTARSANGSAAEGSGGGYPVPLYDQPTKLPL